MKNRRFIEGCFVKSYFRNGGTYSMKRFLFLIITFFLLISIAHGELSVREKVETRSMPSITAPFIEWFLNCTFYRMVS